MCGIVAAVANQDVRPFLLQGLQRLEYRGYDSAGLALLAPDGTLQSRRRPGKITALIESLNANPIAGNTGIAHTRWATHGPPTEQNAHPHLAGNEIALVHNGIIENHEELREELEAAGRVFHSGTDTETAVQLIHSLYQAEEGLLAALQAAALRLKGAFALVAISSREPHHVVGIRRDSPMVVGSGKGGHFLASDPLALHAAPHCRSLRYLRQNESVQLSSRGCQIFDASGKRSRRRTLTLGKNLDAAADKQGHPHYMRKEIFEQPEAVQRTLAAGMVAGAPHPDCFGDRAGKVFARLRAIHIVACGTSYHAGLTASYWIEQLIGIPCRAEIASEYRYRDVVTPPNCLLVNISQSGETADMLASLEKARQQRYLANLAIVNVPHSTLARESQLMFPLHAGPEIGVASTKAFTTQLSALLLLTLAIRRARGQPEEPRNISRELRRLPTLLEKSLALDADMRKLGQDLKNKNHALFLGRNALYPLALEGALKLKEISYIHAEAHPAGELKHGPLALVTGDMPVIALEPSGPLREKMRSNMQEVAARGGHLIILSQDNKQRHLPENATLIQTPTAHPLLLPMVYAIPLQFLAYHTAVARGSDIDQPRNLAKSVTVE